jgi:hypothetical protein
MKHLEWSLCRSGLVFLDKDMRELMGQEVMSEHQLERDISSKNKLNVSLEITHNKVWEETLRARYKILTVMLIDQYMQASCS